MNMQELIDWIRSEKYPDISNKDAIKLIKMNRDWLWPWEECFKWYEHEQQFKKWEQSKDKHYYHVTMLNGGQKFVYMCCDQVIYTYSRYGKIYDVEKKIIFWCMMVEPRGNRTESVHQKIKELVSSADLTGIPTINVSEHNDGIWTDPRKLIFGNV